MAVYVDGFVIPVPKKNVAAYRRMAKAASKVWLDHGALEFRECVGDDLKSEHGISFSKLAKTKSNETVMFSWIVYKSRSHRDRVNKAVMADKRMDKWAKQPMPFDSKRMSYGGFKSIVDA